MDKMIRMRENIFFSAKRQHNFASSNKDNNSNETTKTKTAMKKTVKTLALKTDKVVNLTKAQAQSLVGGRYSDTVTTGLSRCWCRD